MGAAFYYEKLSTDNDDEFITEMKQGERYKLKFCNLDTDKIVELQVPQNAENDDSSDENDENCFGFGAYKKFLVSQ